MFWKGEAVTVRLMIFVLVLTLFGCERPKIGDVISDDQTHDVQSCCYRTETKIHCGMEYDAFGKNSGFKWRCRPKTECAEHGTHIAINRHRVLRKFYASEPDKTWLENESTFLGYADACHL